MSESERRLLLLAAADAIYLYRTAGGSPREGFEDAARLVRRLAEGEVVQHGSLEREPEPWIV